MLICVGITTRLEDCRSRKTAEFWAPRKAGAVCYSPGARGHGLVGAAPTAPASLLVSIAESAVTGHHMEYEVYTFYRKFYLTSRLGILSFTMNASFPSLLLAP